VKCSSAAVIVVLLVFAASAAELIPGRFTFQWGDGAIWISEREAVMADGHLRAGMLDEQDWRQLERWRDNLAAQRERDGVTLQRTGEPCDVEYFGYVMDGGGEPDVETLEALRDVAAERTVIGGVVAASAVGLHNRMPYTVLRMDSESAGSIYLLYAHARMRIEEMMVCNADPLYSEPPAVGDAITVIVSKPLDRSGTLYVAAGSSILYEHAGKLVAAPYLRDDPGIARFESLRDITADLRARQRQ
jgi:hypothetical protein